MINELQKEYFKKKRDEYKAAMLSAYVDNNNALADKWHKLYNEYNDLIEV